LSEGPARFARSAWFFRYARRSSPERRMVGLAFVVAVVAVVLAVVFFTQGQSAASALKALREEADAARKETEVARAELRRAQEDARTRSTQLAETREKLAENAPQGPGRAIGQGIAARRARG